MSWGNYDAERTDETIAQLSRRVREAQRAAAIARAHRREAARQLLRGHEGGKGFGFDD